MWKTTLYDTTRLTVELGQIVDSGVNIWDFEYPSYYEGEAKREFERKVIDHYRFRQIGQETVGRWLHYFRTRIREIMPYYIQRYKSVEIMSGIEDPFGNIDITETFESQTTGTSKGESSSSGNEKLTTQTTEDRTHKMSDTPQGSISNLDSYMSEASVDNNTLGGENNQTTSSSASTEGESSETVRHTLTRKGNQGVNTYAHDMIEFRQSFLNVDLEIIENLNDLFLGVY